MELIFTGPARDAFRLRRNLHDDDIDVVVMTAPNHPDGAVFVPAEAAEKARPTLDRAIERVQAERAARGDGGANEDTPERAPDALYWRAWEAMRAAHARIEPFEQTDSPFDDEDVEWAAAEGLDKLNTVMQAIQDEHGTRGPRATHVAWGGAPAATPSSRSPRRRSPCSPACARSRSCCATRWPTTAP